MAGKTFQDRELAAKVRTATLEEIYAVLQGDDEEYKKALVMKMSTSILPRLNEVSGEGGGTLALTILGESAERYGVSQDTEDSS
tara:strand:+ start:78 stop:329 length:252 start_codon:yes stop_codon:yes gene_type:complete